ncbi:hypothetical protein [Nisaea sp.]|uniref:hypothetical protein n=1 Tax=Nisaea sp. TaxID=2024842 RepID=UPI003B51E5D7
MTTPMNRFELLAGSEERFGELVKRIAYLREHPIQIPPQDPKDVDKPEYKKDAIIQTSLANLNNKNVWVDEISLKSFKSILKEWGIQAKPDPTGKFKVNTVRIAYGDPNSLTFKVPSLAHVEQSEEFLSDGKKYPMPDFYDQIYHPCTANIPNIIRFHCQRIGEYTMSNCI